MRKTTVLLPALIFFAVTAGAGAQQAVDSKTPVIPETAVADSKDCPAESQDCKIICKKFAARTGSLLGGHTECRTKHWWDDRMREDQATTVKIQIEAYHYGPH